MGAAILFFLWRSEIKNYVVDLCRVNIHRTTLGMVSFNAGIIVLYDIKWAPVKDNYKFVKFNKNLPIF